MIMLSEERSEVTAAVDNTLTVLELGPAGSLSLGGQLRCHVAPEAGPGHDLALLRVVVCGVLLNF